MKVVSLVFGRWYIYAEDCKSISFACKILGKLFFFFSGYEDRIEHRCVCHQILVIA